MAPTMMCDGHGPFEGDKCPYPGCTGFWRPYVPERLEVCDAPGCEMPRPCRLHPPGGARAEAAAHRAARDNPGPGSREEPAVGTGAALQMCPVQLRFPWGQVAVPKSGRLNIGRDYGDECGCEIQGFDNVSRVHAIVRVDRDTVLVEDQASTNGTTVNGIQTTAYVAHQIHNGDILGFGATLRAVVELGEDVR